VPPPHLVYVPDCMSIVGGSYKFVVLEAPAQGSEKDMLDRVESYASISTIVWSPCRICLFYVLC